MESPVRKPRGFAAMKLSNPERLKQIASKGGASVDPNNRSFSKDRALAQKAGAKGGSTSLRIV